MTTLTQYLLGLKSVTVRENQRAFHLYKGKLRGILEPGEHILSNRRDYLEFEWHDIDASPELYSSYGKVIFDKLPEIADKHLTVFRTGLDEVAIIERDGKIYHVMGPDNKMIVWNEAGPWKVQKVELSENIEVSPAIMRRLGAVKKTQLFNVIAVPDGQVALLYIDGEYIKLLKAGVHGFWNVGRVVQQKIVDLKRQSLDVSGQELLTKDRVTIRVNLVAEYQVVDPVKAVTEVKDFADTLYRALQYAFRKALGTMTLDQVLEKKVTIDEEAAQSVISEMARIGVKVSQITLKDVILPGEMRDILNTVVAAQKEAEANVIRRREETNATRSLLNTAKVIAENPVMLRLKELEALEAIAYKVERITVHNGAEGLMKGLISLEEK